jgi:hypothetical protein
MRLTRLSIATTILTAWAFAQSRASHSKGRTLYFLKDDTRKEWCGYASEHRLRSAVQPLRAMVVGAADYTDGRVSAVHITEVDETGDWAVNDVYTLDENERIATLTRTINIIPEDTSEEQIFRMRDGKAIKQRSTYRELRTGNPTRNTVDWFEPPPVVTNTDTFHFWALIATKR